MEIKEIFNGHEITIITPEKAADGKPWVWRAEFLGAFDYADKALLEKGWHIAYYKICDMYGCPESVELMKKFHDYIVPKYCLDKKASIFGFSRGGLYTVNYSVKYPEDVSSIYLDAPVLDIRVWPGCLDKYPQAPKEWEECKACYGLTEETAKSFNQNPIDKAEQLIATDIPIIMVCGGADTIVPYETNGALLVEKYKQQGIELTHIIKPECGHHPHSLEDPTPIVDFIIAHYNS